MTVLNLDRNIDKVLGLDDVGIGNLRFTEWGKKYLWDVKFDIASRTVRDELGKFKDFFPASDVEVLTANIDSLPFDLHLSAFKIPQKSEIKDITLTFYDDEANTLFRWFSDWMNLDILNNGNFISALNDDHRISEIEPGLTDSFGSDREVWPIRAMQIRRLDSMMKPISQNTYLVYPEGQLTYNGSSASEAVIYTLKFIILGEYKKVQPIGGLTTATSFAQEMLGRFI